MRELPAGDLPIEMVAISARVLDAVLQDLGVAKAPTFASSIRGQAVLYIVQTWNASGFSRLATRVRANRESIPVLPCLFMMSSWSRLNMLSGEKPSESSKTDLLITRFVGAPFSIAYT